MIGQHLAYSRCVILTSHKYYIRSFPTLSCQVLSYYESKLFLVQSALCLGELSSRVHWFVQQSLLNCLTHTHRHVLCPSSVRVLVFLTS